MSNGRVQVPEEMRPVLSEAREAYASWLEYRDADDYDFFDGDKTDESAARFAASIDRLIEGSLSSGVDRTELRQALVSAFPIAVDCGLLDVDALDQSDGDGLETVEVPNAPVHVVFRESAVEPTFTYAYSHHGQPREFRFFEKHLTYHDEGLGVGRERFYVVPYSLITYLEYAQVDEGSGPPKPVVFIYAADLNLSAAGSEADVAAIIERLTSLIG